MAVKVEGPLAEFGKAAYSKLQPGIGEPEDQLRGPFEALMSQLAEQLGVSVTLVGEAHLAKERTRPDYAITLGGDPLPIGFAELKAPGKGADAERFAKGHDRKQWLRLRALPNLIYTDGPSWTLYRSGEKTRVARLEGDLRDGPSLADPKGHLAPLVADFINWEPKPPTTTVELVSKVAGLCRLLRAEIEELVVTSAPLRELAKDWRQLLYPEATDDQFADGYAQAVTFALLLARAEEIDFKDKSIAQISKLLGKKHSLLGRALEVLTDETLLGSLETAVQALQRVISVVKWSGLTDRGEEPWLMFYEEFLADYDPELRKQTGSYYTPNEVVAAMVRMTDDLLRNRLGQAAGFASPHVTTVDPAMGTGTFLLHIARQVANFVTDAQGEGAAPAQLRDLTKRLIGFERQLGPYAVAELRVFEELERRGAEVSADSLRLYVADTLDDPYEAITHLGGFYAPIAKSREAASEVKREERVMVVIGNPPYRDKAAGLGGWVEHGDPSASTPALMDDFLPPAEWGVGAHVKHVYNLYVYFWRWALWKVFESDPDANHGVVSFITSAGFIDGPGLAGVRRHMRAVADEIWVINVSPEGHQPPVPTRVFRGVQRPLCITLLVRTGNIDRDTPATVRQYTVEGLREQKFAQLHELDLDGSGWVVCLDGWSDRFTPGSSSSWSDLPLVGDLMPWSSPGVSAHRTWPVAPDADVLRTRWNKLVRADPADKAALFREARDTKLTKKRKPLPDHPHEGVFDEEKGSCPEPVRYALTTLDRQWIVPDPRLINDPRPPLWRSLSEEQVFVSELHTERLRGGPSLTFAADVPSLHHYKGSEGGRILPLWRDSGSGAPNVLPGLLDYLTTELGFDVAANDLVGYVAGVAAHGGYADSFLEDLAIPGVRIPLSRDPGLWKEAVAVGSKVVWLYTYGRRYIDPLAGRRAESPKLPESERPKVTSPIPDDEGNMPETISYDAEKETLHIGTGAVHPVPRSSWEFDVSGYLVVQRWLQRRLRDPEGTRSSDLDEIVATKWSATFTTELLELLNVVGLLVAEGRTQADLLKRILGHDLVGAADLRDAGLLPVPAEARKPVPAPDESGKTPLF